MAASAVFATLARRRPLGEPAISEQLSSRSAVRQNEQQGLGGTLPLRPRPSHNQGFPT
ncbi:hypothetical protein SKP52_05600 [Sphingopyxis fribergensis]|uniref:Uncharacterized protein n=1 Tax=Sphingopyxis fribergensis TaxID=1515612 RepID=A0A0A7PDF1_9SPHN|nr:hypothetical protein SKP52_05600 [Sphingopyxis fribergensis]